jgi:malonyl-CoA/methylmalonyl-CoA synthetase
MDALSTSWRWRSSDSILHTLPVHHIHGLVNALMCAHYNGAEVDFLPFSGRPVWARLLQGKTTVYMGVPSMYTHLLHTYEKFDVDKKAACRQAAAALRLAVCGSAACPKKVMNSWQALAGEVRCSVYLSVTVTGALYTEP